MEQFADDLAAWLDALAIREPVVFCGLSMGGYIAFQFWRRFAARLRGLILCDTKAVADTPEGAAARQSTAERVLREGTAPVVEAMLPKLLAESTERQRPELVERLRSMIAAGNPQGIAAAARGMAERPDMTGALRRNWLPDAGGRGPARCHFTAGGDARVGCGDRGGETGRDSRRRSHGRWKTRRPLAQVRQLLT